MSGALSVIGVLAALLIIFVLIAWATERATRAMERRIVQRFRAGMFLMGASVEDFTDAELLAAARRLGRSFDPGSMEPGDAERLGQALARAIGKERREP